MRTSIWRGHDTDEDAPTAGSNHRGAISTAFFGETLGSANARAETTREVNDYALGLVIGFQVGTAWPFLTGTEAEGGTPGRFLWLSANDKSIPHPKQRKRITLDPSEWPHQPEIEPRPLTMPDTVLEEIRISDWENQMGINWAT